MEAPKNHTLKNTARNLRKEMTREEKHLWYDFLKKLPLTVNRQKQLDRFIVDFLISKASVVIEVDGAQHFTEEGRLEDAQRDRLLNERGFTVLRYSNLDVKTDFEGVCTDILRALSEKGIRIEWDEIFKN